LAVAYATGTGVSRDAPRAAALYKVACEGGALEGCFNLGVAYQKGTGVPLDALRAKAVFSRACDGGLAAACTVIRQQQ